MWLDMNSVTIVTLLCISRWATLGAPIRSVIGYRKKKPSPGALNTESVHDDTPILMMEERLVSASAEWDNFLGFVRIGSPARLWGFCVENGERRE